MLKRDRSDATNIPDEMKRDDYPLMKTDSECRCIALEGVVGRFVQCGVYEVRPEACRRFKAGSQLCLEARKAKGLPIC